MMSMWTNRTLVFAVSAQDIAACTELAIIRPMPAPMRPPRTLVTAASRILASIRTMSEPSESPSAILKAMWPSIGRISVAM